MGFESPRDQTYSRPYDATYSKLMGLYVPIERQQDKLSPWEERDRKVITELYGRAKEGFEIRHDRKGYPYLVSKYVGPLNDVGKSSRHESSGCIAYHFHYGAVRFIGDKAGRRDDVREAVLDGSAFDSLEQTYDMAKRNSDTNQDLPSGPNGSNAGKGVRVLRFDWADDCAVMKQSNEKSIEIGQREAEIAAHPDKPGTMVSAEAVLDSIL